MCYSERHWPHPSKYNEIIQKRVRGNGNERAQCALQLEARVYSQRQTQLQRFSHWQNFRISIGSHRQSVHNSHVQEKNTLPRWKLINIFFTICVASGYYCTSSTTESHRWKRTKIILRRCITWAHHSALCTRLVCSGEFVRIKKLN